MGYLERLDTYREDMIRTLGESVAFPSVNSDPVKTQDMVLQLGLERFGYRWRPEPEAVQK